MENWKQIEKWPKYEVSNLGRIKRISSFGGAKVGRILRLHKVGAGYFSVMFYKKSFNGKLDRKREYIHRLVAITFIGNPPKNRPQVNHKDGNKSNNCVDNLEWVNVSENHFHAFKLGLRKTYRHSKLTAEQVYEIRNTNKFYGYRKYFADKFKISPDTVGSIISRKRWWHI